jgi:hypothetical protein
MKNSSSLGLIVSVIAGMGCMAKEDGGTTARVRVAHLSPGAPAVDFCLAPAGSGEFAGPVLAGAGAADGLAYGNVTKYLDVEAMQYDVRLVAPGSKDCATSLGGLPDITDLPELPAGASATIAAEGHVVGTVPFAVRAYIDDATVAFGKIKLRFIHASPGTPNVDIGLGGGVAFTPVFQNVAYAGTPGYLETGPIQHGELSARLTGTAADVISVKPARLEAGTIATAFAIGDAVNPHAPLDVLLCSDNGGPIGLLSDCKHVGGAPERARVRIAHLSPDAPAVDICIAEAGSGNFGEPLLRSLGAPTGLWYSQVTTYVEIPARAYDVRIILATATGCGAGAVPDTTNIMLQPNLTATIAAIGVLDRTGAAANDPAFRLQVLVDEPTVSSGRTKLRFFHASPGTPAVDVGLGYAHLFQRVFANVSFGQTAPGNGAAMSPNGFVETAPVTSAVSARLANALTDALTIPSVNLATDQVATAIAIGGKTGTTQNPLRVLVCLDNAPPKALLSTCIVTP